MTRMNRAELQRAIDASQARALALMNDLADLHARMPDKGVDPLPEEQLLLAAITVEHTEAQRLAGFLRDRGRSGRWMGIAGLVVVVIAVVAVVFALFGH